MKFEKSENGSIKVELTIIEFAWIVAITLLVASCLGLIPTESIMAVYDAVRSRVGLGNSSPVIEATF